MENLAASYIAVKHLHFSFIALSVLLYLFSFGAHLAQSNISSYKIVKVTPHVINTLLIVSGVFLCFIVHQYPVSSPWLTEKMVALLFYIGLAIYSLKSTRSVLFKVTLCFGALSWVIFAAKIAILKQSLMMG